MYSASRLQRPRRHGLTLLELTVAIAIVAVAGVYLLGIVRKVQRAGGDVTCQSNLAQIGDALLAYCVDNNGSYPYGYYYDPRHPVTWEPTSGKSREIRWIDVIDPYLAVTAGRGK